MRKLLHSAAIALMMCAAATPPASAQSGMFVYAGVPTVPVAPGSSFTVRVDLMVSGMSGSGGPGVNHIAVVSYWMAQSNPAGGPFPFQITNRDWIGSLFNNGSGGLVYPQIMDPINRNPNGTTFSTDLGFFLDISHPGLPNGTYYIAALRFVFPPPRRRAPTPSAIRPRQLLASMASSTPATHWWAGDAPVLRCPETRRRSHSVLAVTALPHNHVFPETL